MDINDLEEENNDRLNGHSKKDAKKKSEAWKDVKSLKPNFGASTYDKHRNTSAVHKNAKLDGAIANLTKGKM